MSKYITTKEDLVELTEAWEELEERCPDCGGMESHCEEVGCLSEEWTDEDTRRYQQGVKQ